MVHGPGQVLRGFTRVALIFWGSTWQFQPDVTEASTVNGMWQHVGTNPWTDSLLQYWDNWSSVDDTGRLYVGAWTDLGSSPASIYTQADVAAEVQRALTVGPFQYDPNTLYMVFANRGAQNDQGSTVCGYHSFTGAPQGGLAAYAVMDYGHCSDVQLAGAVGDGRAQRFEVVSLHEFAEGVTDPFMDAWGNGQSGSEIGDLCQDNLITVNFGGTGYAAQQIYGNNEGRCLSSTTVSYSYRWISQTYVNNNQASAPGNTYPVSLVVQNTGNVQWPVNSVLRLGTDAPQDHCSAYYDPGTWSGCIRVGGMVNQINSAYSTIQPGQDAVFTFNFFTNPAQTCTTVNEHFNLVFEARLWMASAGIYWPVNIGCYDASFNSETPPTALVVGDNPVTNMTKIRFVNTGNLPWNNDSKTQLTTNGCSMFYDMVTWSACNVATSRVTNVSNTGKTSVDPGEVGEFDVVLSVPAATVPGNYGQQWVLVEAGFQTMGSSYHTSTYNVVA
jgi:hypothetical protein